MTLNDYQQKALVTAKDEKVELIHRALGLAGEAGEIADKMARWMRSTQGDELQLDKAELSKEIGDVLWYTATLADYLGYSLEEIAQANLVKLSDRDNRGLINKSGDNR